MAITKTFNLLGEAFAESGNVNLVITVDGTEVHNGAITTTSGSAPEMGSYSDARDNVLASFNIETSGIAGSTANVSVAVSGGCVILGEVSSNWVGENGGDADTVVVLAADSGANIKQNFAIDGLAQVDGTSGEMHYLVDAGSTATFSLDKFRTPAA